MEKQLTRWNIGADVTVEDRERIRSLIRDRGLRVSWLVVRLLLLWAKDPRRFNLEEGTINA